MMNGFFPAFLSIKSSFSRYSHLKNDDDDDDDDDDDSDDRSILGNKHQLYL